MQGHSSDKSRQRSRALVPVSRSLEPADPRLRGITLEGHVPPPPRSGFWQKTAKFVGGAAVVGAFVLAIANGLAPSTWVEARAISWLKAHTGHDLAVRGKTQLSFWPAPHIQMTDAVISAPNAAADAPRLAIPKIEIDLGFFDFVMERASIERVVLERPVLTVDADGRTQTPPPVAAETATPLGTGAARAIVIQEFLVRDGTVLVHSARRALPRRFERVNVDVRMTAPSAPAAGNGQLNWKGKSIAFDFELASPETIVRRGTAQLRLGIDADTVSARYVGDLATKPQLQGQGTFFAQTRSVRQFFAWLKGVSGAVPVRGDGEMTSTISWSSASIDFSDIRFTQDFAKGSGDAMVSFVDPRPRVEGSFIVDDVDLGPALALVGRGPLPGAGAARPLSLAVAAAPDTPRELSSNTPSVQVERAVTPPPGLEAAGRAPRLLLPGPGVSQPSLTIAMPQPAIDRVLAMAAPGGSAEPMFDAEIDLDIRQAKLRGMRIGPSAVSLDFKGGTLNAKLWHMDFYGGDGRGAMSVAVTEPVSSFTGDFRLEDVDTRSLLKDALGVDRIGGQARLTVNVSGRGGNWDTLALSLMGNGAFAIANGAIDGISPAGLVKDLDSGVVDLHRDPNAVMPFSLLAGSFDINHGRASTRNLRLRSPQASINADGVVNLRRESLDFVINPGPVAKEQGGGVASTGEHLSPLRIAGPLMSPRIGLASNSLATGTNPATPDLVIPGIVLRERRGGQRQNQVTSGGVAAGETQQPRALAPAFGVAPAGN